MLATLLLAQILLFNGAPRTPVSCTLPDTFTSDTFSSCYTIDYGVGEFAFEGINGEIDYTQSGNDESYVRFNTALAGDTGYAKVTIKNWTAPTGSFVGIILRATSTASGAKYVIQVRMDGGRVYWRRLVGQTATDITGGGASYHEPCGTTWGTGDTLGVDWTGTGGTTTIRVWRNPVGAYGDWSTATCTFSDCGSTCVDTGTYAGFYGDGSNASFDDYDAGAYQADQTP